MRILLYECFSGIAGDMNLGALLDLGMPEDYLRNGLSSLGLNDDFQLTVDRAKKHGISGTLATVTCRDTSTHRHFPYIRDLIESSSIEQDVKDTAISAFRNLADAEAKIHDIHRDEVHFHEVGAIDAIVDIVGSAIGLHYFKPDQVFCGPIELGSGMVKCAHGMMPVPAPATAELLIDCPTTRGRVTGEATTPTGAAILSACVDAHESPKNFRASRVAYGLGQKNFEVPNVLRLALGETDSNLERETNIEIECNIDDMNPEAFEPLFDQLFAADALDVFVTPMIMKKSRPANRLTVLAKSQDQEELIRIILSGSTTLGVRVHSVEKHMVPRESRILNTRYGDVKVKIGTLPDGEIRWKTEHEDIKRIAQDLRMNYMTVKSEVDNEVRGKLIDDG